jgi:hypothetical protein
LGADVLHGERGKDELFAGGDADDLVGRRGVDLLVGGDAADALFGGGGADILRAGAGFDSPLIGGDDDDIVDGGTDGGTASFLFASRGVTADLSMGTATGEGQAATLPSEGLLDSLAAKGGLIGGSITAVGYGTTDPAVFPRFPADRRVASSRIQALNPSRLLVSIQDGGACVADSGGPAFLSVAGHDVAVALNSLPTTDPNCGSLADYYRLDTPGAQAFLSQFVTLP